MHSDKSIGMVALAVFICATLSLSAISPAEAADYYNPAVPGKEHPAYWLDRGGLLATYGNFPAAVKAFNQALKMDPGSSEAHFDLGLAYMEMGRFDQALGAIDKALQLDAGNGVYLYGRARVLLLSGQKEKSLADFKAAADAGVPEAIKYMAR